MYYVGKFEYKTFVTVPTYKIFEYPSPQLAAILKHLSMTAGNFSRGSFFEFLPAGVTSAARDACEHCLNNFITRSLENVIKLHGRIVFNHDKVGP